MSGAGVNGRLAEVMSGTPRSRDLRADVDALFYRYGREVTREHVPRAAAQGRELAFHFGVSPDQAEVALLLHNIGGVFRLSEMGPLCEAMGLPVHPEERQVPMLLHAKLSVVLAREWQGVTDTGILQAVGYHTNS